MFNIIIDIVYIILATISFILFVLLLDKFAKTGDSKYGNWAIIFLLFHHHCIER